MSNLIALFLYLSILLKLWCILYFNLHYFNNRRNIYVYFTSSMCLFYWNYANVYFSIVTYGEHSRSWAWMWAHISKILAFWWLLRLFWPTSNFNLKILFSKKFSEWLFLIISYAKLKLYANNVSFVFWFGPYFGQKMLFLSFFAVFTWNQRA